MGVHYARAPAADAHTHSIQMPSTFPAQRFLRACIYLVGAIGCLIGIGATLRWKNLSGLRSYWSR